MVWWMAIPAVISAVSSISQYNASQSQSENSAAWANYNNTVAHNNSLSNLTSQMMITSMNAMLNTKAAELTAQRQLDSAYLNASIVAKTTEYNNDLLAQDEALMWESVGLDLQQLETQRAVEKGTIVADQAASGTVLDQDSNAEVVIDQMTQGAMDAFIVERSADIQASKIHNTMAQNKWQGEVEIQKIMWEGQSGAALLQGNAALQNMGSMAEATMAGMAGVTTADQGLVSGQAGVEQYLQQSNFTSQQNLTNGLFSAAGRGVSSYYASAEVDTTGAGTSLMTEKK